MKNIRKIIILMILIASLINNVTANDVYEGNFSFISLVETDEVVTSDNIAETQPLDRIYIQDGSNAENLKSVYTYMDYSIWDGDTDYQFFKCDATYTNMTDYEIGTGYIYFWKMNTDDDPAYETVYIKVYFENGLSELPSGRNVIKIVSDISSMISCDHWGYKVISTYSGDNNCLIMGNSGVNPLALRMYEGTHTSKIYKTFYNNYTYMYNEYEDLLDFNLYRNTGNSSKIVIIDSGDNELINETSLKTENLNVASDMINYSIWDIVLTDNIGNIYERTLNFIPEIEDLTPTLTTDKLLYNTSEQITISFANIDEIEGYEIERLSLYILYPVIHESKDYAAKYMLHLLGDKRDETFTLNTTFLTPQNEYHLAVCVDGDFHQIDDALIISDTFYVYDDNEYLTTSCNPEGNCYTYNNNDITIYYRINNNSDIIIKDNDGTTIQTYYNIIDEGEINYHIPNDENKLNSYPDWKIYLNNTEYSTNYSTDVTVYWSLFATPTPTPIYTVDIPDENVSEQIDELKKESKPIFDLIYGLTTLVVDNPDYDNDNIVDEHEINNWFNSLIPLGILLLLIILYMGLKKRD